MALLSPGGAVPSGTKLLMLTVYNVFRRLLGSSGVFLPEVLPGKEKNKISHRGKALRAIKDELK